jgi:hypothetical protein
MMPFAKLKSPSGHEGRVLLPQDFLDSNFLNYGNLTTDYSSNDRKLTPRSPMPSEEKGVASDFKTAYEVDRQKLLPLKGFPLYGSDANMNSRMGSHRRKSRSCKSNPVRRSVGAAGPVSRASGRFIRLANQAGSARARSILRRHVRHIPSRSKLGS